MATIINNPPSQNRVEPENRGMGGFLLGLIILIVLAVLLFAFGIPALRRSSSRSNTRSTTNNINPQVQIPGNSGGTGSSGTGTTMPNY